MAYAPAGVTTANLSHLASVYYDRTALSSLRKVFRFWLGVDNRVLPKKNGKTVQMFRYSQLGANTTPVPAEGGGPGQSLTMASSTVSATVAQYSDFITLSDMLVDTAIDGDIVSVAADQLGYRGGLTFDTIIRNEADSAAASIDVALLGDYLSSADLANVRHRLQGLDIKPFPDGFFKMIIHPYVSYDLVNDPSVGGFKDIVKQGGWAEGSNILKKMDDRGLLMRFNSHEVWESTNVTVVAGTPNKYRCYIFAQEALGAIDLAGRGPTRTMDQDKTKFSVYVEKDAGRSLANPEGKIRAFASYNVVFVAKLLDTVNYRLRKIDAPSSLGL